MSNRFHNKFHRHNHHTQPTDRSGLYPDSAYDPIASPEAPFKGEFYSEGDITTTQNVSAGLFLHAPNATISNGLVVRGIFIEPENWNDSYTIVSTNSANWSDTYTAVTLSSTNWNSAYKSSTVLQALTGNWENTYTTVQANSSNWVQDLDDVLSQGNTTNQSFTANVITATKFYGDASGLQGTTTGPDWALRALSADWQSNYTTVNTSSASWNSAYESTTAIQGLTGNWNSAYESTTAIQGLTGNWENTYNDVSLYSPDWQNVTLDVQTNSPNWNSSYNTVQTSSPAWDSVYTLVNSQSAAWSSQVSPTNVYSMQPGEASYNSDDYIAISINGVTRYIKLYDIATPPNAGSFGLTVNTGLTSL